MADAIPKTEVGWWLVYLKDAAIKESNDGKVDLNELIRLINETMKKVINYQGVNHG